MYRNRLTMINFWIFATTYHSYVINFWDTSYKNIDADRGLIYKGFKRDSVLDYNEKRAKGTKSGSKLLISWLLLWVLDRLTQFSSFCAFRPFLPIDECPFTRKNLFTRKWRNFFSQKMGFWEKKCVQLKFSQFFQQLFDCLKLETHN